PLPPEYTVMPAGQGSSAAATSHAPVRSSAMTCSGSTAIASGQQHRACRRAVQLRKLERQTDQRVPTRLDAPEIEPLDDEHAGAQEQVVHGKLPAAELLDREIVDAAGSHAALAQQPGGVERQVGEVALELRSLPACRVVRQTEDDVARSDRRAGKGLAVHRAPSPQVQHDRLADHAVE